MSMQLNAGDKLESKRLKSTCKDIQQYCTEKCICQGSFTIIGFLDPCEVPCAPVMENFLELKRYND